MADRPIIFSAPMVRALLAGRKSMTRRIIKPRPEYCGGGRARDPQNWSDPDAWGWENHDEGCWDLLSEGYTGRPYYAPGDRLWVRETWRADANYDDLSPSEMSGEEAVKYEADGSEQMWGWPAMFVPGRLRSPIHMPRWASRLTLTVTDVRVQRLQAISEADALAEGVEMESADPPFFYVPGIWPHSLTAVGIEDGRDHAIRSYGKLWNHLHGPDAWDANPWVCALTFTVAHQNIDAMREAAK